MTHYERITSMSIEELAELLLDYDCDFDCWRVMGIAKSYPEDQKAEALKAQIKWLESEASL